MFSGISSPAPSLDLDLYAGDVLADSRDAFARIRDAGPVVWLPRNRLYAVGRFSDVRAALRDDARYRSGHGVAVSRLSNRLGRDTTLFSDDDVHTRRRRVMLRSLGAKALAAVEPSVQPMAEAVVADLLRRDWFEASAAFSSRLPLGVVADLVGLQADSARMLQWAAATFDVLGPPNRRALGAMHRSLGLLRVSRTLTADQVSPDSWAASVFAARDAGELTTAEARALCIDFVAPALDTTILAATHLLWMLGAHPEVWTAIREAPELIPRAVVEGVRLSSPIRGFTRRVAETHELGGIELPAGARVVLLFGAANLDETAFPEPERFDLARANRVQLGWGNGAHTCVGIHLAKLELQALLTAMVPSVARIHTGYPERLRNNTLQGIARMPARFTPA